MLYQQFANIGMPFKHRVAGSSPARLTRVFCELRGLRLYFRRSRRESARLPFKISPSSHTVGLDNRQLNEFYGANCTRISRSADRPWSSMARIRCSPSAVGCHGKAPAPTGCFASKAPPSNQKTFCTSAAVLDSRAITRSGLDLCSV